MNNKKVQLIVMNAMIGAAYAVLTILISPIAYGAVQMRLTELLFYLHVTTRNLFQDLLLDVCLQTLHLQWDYMTFVLEQLQH